MQGTELKNHVLALCDAVETTSVAGSSMLGLTKRVRKLCARAMVQPDGWQPIETAPRDGTAVLLATALSYADGYWLQSAYNGNGAWIWPYAYKEPRYWMPLLRVPK